MQRGTVAWVMGAILAVAAVPQAGAGTVTLTTSDPVIVPAGTNIVVDVDLQAAGTFDFTNILIGSPVTVTNLTFDADDEWDTAFPGTSSEITFNEPTLALYARNVNLMGDIVGSGTAGPTLDLGDLTIVTTGMAPGEYSLGVNTDDSYTQNFNSEGDPDPLTSNVLLFTIVPEPAAAVLLIGGVVLLRRRR